MTNKRTDRTRKVDVRGRASKKTDVGLDHSWAKKRSQNIEKMWRQAGTDDDYALAIAMDVINARANDMWNVGDTSYSILLSAVAGRLSNIRIAMQERERKAKKKRSPRKGTEP